MQYSYVCNSSILATYGNLGNWIVKMKCLLLQKLVRAEITKISINTAGYVMKFLTFCGSCIFYHHYGKQFRPPNNFQRITDRDTFDL